MDVTFLGTGAALPTGDRYQAGLVVDGEDPLLIDCGAGVLQRLAQAGYDVTDVDTVLLTHHHLDHVADLPSLAKARWLADEPSMRIVGPPDTREYLESYLAIDDLPERLELTIDEREADAFALADYRIETCETVHSASGYAYRIDDALTISGDTEAADRIADFAGGTTLFHDCAYPDEDRSNHATPRALGDALADTDLDALYLTHLYPAAADAAEEMQRTVAEYVDTEVRIATDLATITVDAA